MVATEEVVRRPPDPVVEARAPLGVVEPLEDRVPDLPVHELRERAARVVQVLLELRTETPEDVADERAGLEAFDQRGPQPFRLVERRGLPGGEPVREAAEAVEDDAAERMAGVRRGAAELGGGVVARRLDDLLLDDLPAEHERHEPASASAQRARRAVEPPVELVRRPGTLGEVRERRGEGPERDTRALAGDGAREPSSRLRVDGELAELSLQGA